MSDSPVGEALASHFAGIDFDGLQVLLSDLALCLHGLAPDAIQQLITSSGEARLRQIVKSTHDRVDRVLIWEAGRVAPYEVPMSDAGIIQRLGGKGISRHCQEILAMPFSTCLVSMQSDRILAGSRKFSELARFATPLEAWGLSTRSTWLPHELERLTNTLEGMPIDTPVGTQENPYEYVGLSMSDVVRLMGAGLTEREALGEARRVRIGSTYLRTLVDGCPCRVSTQHYFEFL